MMATLTPYLKKRVESRCQHLKFHRCLDRKLVAWLHLQRYDVSLYKAITYYWNIYIYIHILLYIYGDYETITS